MSFVAVQVITQVTALASLQTTSQVGTVSPLL